ncbi:response regulator transcription factor [Methylobacterium sp. M6A4_1b]
MNDAVGVLIVGEPLGVEPAFRAVIEHEPRLHTLSETELSQGPARKVALVFVGSEPEPGLVARIAALKARAPDLHVLVGFDVLRADLLTRLIEVGAEAFIARSATPRDMCGALLSLAAGSAGPVPGEDAPAAAAPVDGLTPREAEILRFLSAGFSNKEVARRLNLSVRTVETHRLNLRRKTQTGRLKDLVALARHLGLAPVVDAGPVRGSGGDRPRSQLTSACAARL